MVFLLILLMMRRLFGWRELLIRLMGLMTACGEGGVLMRLVGLMGLGCGIT